MGSKQSRIALIALCLTTSPVAAQTHDSVKAGRWLGGLREADDYTAITLHLRNDRGAWQAQLAFPNQNRTWLADSVGVSGSQIRIFDGATLWVGRLERASLIGETSGERVAGFELVLAPEFAQDDVIGEYASAAGNRFRIDLMTRPSDQIYRLTDRSSGEQRWLFPVRPNEFTTGHTFESPLPVESSIVVRGKPGSPVLERRRGGTSEIAGRVLLTVDSIALDKLISRIMENDRTPGAAVSILTADGARYGRTFGLAEVEKSVPITNRTRFQIGSVTKTLTAMLTLRLRDQGVLRIDDRVADILPDSVRFPDARADAITVRHLLTHTAGLPGNPWNRIDSAGVMLPYSIDDLYRGIRRTVLQGEPGANASYSNFGYAILGHLIELKTQQRFETALSREIFRPLDMRSAIIALDARSLATLASHYWPEDSVLAARPPWLFGEVSAFGGVSMTIDDLNSYVTALLRPANGVLSESTLREMQAPQYLRSSWSSGFGYSWFVERNGAAGILVYHGGEVDGHSAYVAIAPLLGLGVVVLANMGGGSAETLAQAVLSHAVASVVGFRTFTTDEASRFFIDRHWQLAARAYESLLEGRPDWGVALYRAGYAWFQAGDHDKALPHLIKASEREFMPELASYYAAIMSAQRGAHDQAIKLLQRAVQMGYRNHGEIRSNAAFHVLREDPAFNSILSDIQ